MANLQIFNLELLETKDYENMGVSTKNIHELTYTLLAGSAACMRLKIQRTAYRLLSPAENPGTGLLVLIHKSESLPSNKIAAPYSVISCFGNKVTLKRENLGIYTLNNSVLPQLPEATELCVYIHPSSLYFNVAKDMITNEVFIVSTRRQEIYVNFAWFRNKQCLKGYGSDALLQYRRLIAECDNQKYTNYLKINLKGAVAQQNLQKFNSCLFIPGKSKLVIHKAQHYDLNQITKIITLPKLYAQIFTHPPYLRLSKLIANHIQDKPDKKMILLKILEGVGISSFLHKISQDHDYSFVRINCKYFVREGQLLQKIKNSESFSSTVIYIKNIEWLLEVGNEKNDEQEKMKRIIRALEESFFNLGDRGLTSHILIIGFKGNSIKFDMTKNANLLNFQINKEQRMSIFSNVTESCKRNEQIELADPEEVVKLAANSLGWVTFSNIIRNLHRTNKKGDRIQTQQVLKQIGKLVSMEKVENIKNVTWDDVGGLENAKQEIIQTILLPTKHPQIFDEWIKPRTGLLFFGPPGTGKTLLGKCIANQCKMGFISVKGPELLNMYIGESEKNVRDIFERAAESSPCIVFMDQLDALIPKRGQSSDSNQVMDRILSELLTQMDKAPSKGIFIIGATNRPDLLDPAILRPGRFDKQIYLGITKDKQARVQILKAQTRHLNLRQGFDYDKVIESVPQNFTGADFYGLTTRSITKAAQRFIDEYERKQKSEKDEVKISEQDFIETAKQMKPSVSMQELARYEKLRDQYK